MSSQRVAKYCRSIGTLIISLIHNEFPLPTKFFIYLKKKLKYAVENAKRQVFYDRSVSGVSGHATLILSGKAENR